MPPIWTGTLTFGLVAIPIRMESAVHSHKVAFRQIHREDQGRVKYVKTCEEDGQRLTQDDIGRAYEAPDGRLVPIEDRELDEMPLPTAKTLEVSGFLDLASVPSEMFDQPYFLAPSTPAANKPYVLMREALAKAGKAAVGKYALRGSGEALGIVHAQGDVLVLQRLRWPDELRPAGDAAPRGDIDITDDERAAADDYIRAVGDVDMAQMHDEYAEAVRALIEAKAGHKAAPKARPAREEEAGVTDLMTTLQAAADKARQDKGKADVHDIDRKARKTAKKSPAKKAGRKRAG
ncbi:DNA end-binding protein Ku [Streptomyces sp. DvalAA-14]|uniref:non-homologous end joining protein Ku n=1 Tax=unclassified Streptomyces TaxID=2593676 RepID=UPI00081AFB19|nr:MULTISPECIES: Ku protein [unclassified Streptomyces]MYS20474.1 Ku protein [Streptomyces sp. SID4948]SCD69696.1 DNA end-binding protein Ku [Streptomyces sp. DvalAA-14]